MMREPPINPHTARVRRSANPARIFRGSWKILTAGVVNLIRSAKPLGSEQLAYSEALHIERLDELLCDFNGLLVSNVSQMNDTSAHDFRKARPARLLLPYQNVLN